MAKIISITIHDGKHERGIFLYGTGIGVFLVANKTPRISGTLCHEYFQLNNAQFITMDS